MASGRPHVRPPQMGVIQAVPALYGPAWIRLRKRPSMTFSMDGSAGSVRSRRYAGGATATICAVPAGATQDPAPARSPRLWLRRTLRRSSRSHDSRNAFRADRGVTLKEIWEQRHYVCHAERRCQADLQHAAGSPWSFDMAASRRWPAPDVLVRRRCKCQGRAGQVDRWSWFLRHRSGFARCGRQAAPVSWRTAGRAEPGEVGLIACQSGCRRALGVCHAKREAGQHGARLRCPACMPGRDLVLRANGTAGDDLFHTKIRNARIEAGAAAAQDLGRLPGCLQQRRDGREHRGRGAESLPGSR